MATSNSNQVRPNYGSAPKGKAQIMLQGQTKQDAFGQDPYVTGILGTVTDNGNLGRDA